MFSQLLFNHILGAMENWGLVTYRETALLIDPANSSSSTKQWVALVVGHELAHQWFGNLVTMVGIAEMARGYRSQYCGQDPLRNSTPLSASDWIWSSLLEAFGY